MHAMTVSYLQSIFAGESQAHMRYLIYAQKDEKDGFVPVWVGLYGAEPGWSHRGQGLFVRKAARCRALTGLAGRTDSCRVARAGRRVCRGGRGLRHRDGVCARGVAISLPTGYRLPISAPMETPSSALIDRFGRPGHLPWPSFGCHLAATGSAAHREQRKTQKQRQNGERLGHKRLFSSWRRAAQVDAVNHS